jgi:hypothetical protein
MTEALKTAADSVMQAVNTDSIYEVAVLLGILNGHGDESTQCLCNDCSSEMTRLTSMLAQLRSEDRRYHEAVAAASRNTI